MRPLSVQEMIRVWEHGETCSPLARALLVLHAGEPDTPIEALAQLSIGERDRRLLQLRERTLGAGFSCSVDCPRCGEDLSFDLETEQLLRPAAEDSRKALTLSAGDYSIQFRLANSEDLSEALRAASVEEGHKRILARCLLDVRRESQEAAVDELPESVIHAICEAMGKHDAQADVQFEVRCDRCGTQWTTVFDVAAFFCKEISVRARRALSEVHALASAYGWGEEEILNMSAARRNFYLQMVEV